MRRYFSRTPVVAHRQDGFTIVELLIVIVVIAILVAIVFVVYNGITARAHAASLQSDLRSGSGALGMSKADNGQYPSSLSSTGDSQALHPSSGTTFTYQPNANGTNYCLQAAGSGMSYFITNSDTVPQGGICNGSEGLAGNPSDPPQVPMVSALAGNGTYGLVNGPGASAEFDQPFGVAVDSAGNVYVADSVNNSIRKIAPSGVVSTLAGNGTQGYVNGPDASAEFDQPFGVAVDSAGNVYVADSGNNLIRKITTNGVVSTFAGNGTAGYVDGPGASAEFNSPEGVAVDSAGNVYVADSNTSFIRKITGSGVVSTLAGNGSYGFVNGPGSSAEFSYLTGITVDSAGNVYVADSRNNVIRKITANGVVSTFAGNGTAGYVDGPGASAEFNYPNGVAVDSAGNVYVADEGNSFIREVTPSGMVSTLAGNGTQGHVDGPGVSAEFVSPTGVAVDSAGNVYVADESNSIISKIVP